MTGAVRAVLFDKDGTLFDFEATWNIWTGRLLQELSGGDETLWEALARAILFDPETGGFLPGSPAIAGTNIEVAKALAVHLPGTDPVRLERHLSERAAEAPLREAVPLDPYLRGLASRGLALGVMTNDSEISARAHLDAVGVFGHFDFVAGADSGYGAKPDPDPLWAFCNMVDVVPEQAVMVGDSAHDLVAARAAGMIPVGVLTGLAPAEELASLARVVLPDIGHLPGWLETTSV